MKARVRLFAILREKVGASEVTLELPERSTVADLMKEMAHRYPALLEGVAHTMVAVNTEYVQQSQLLHDGDEVALIPPVSGGAPYNPHRSAPQPNRMMNPDTSGRPSPRPHPFGFSQGRSDFVETLDLVGAPGLCPSGLLFFNNLRRPRHDATTCTGQPG